MPAKMISQGNLDWRRLIHPTFSDHPDYVFYVYRHGWFPREILEDSNILRLALLKAAFQMLAPKCENRGPMEILPRISRFG